MTQGVGYRISALAIVLVMHLVLWLSLWLVLAAKNVEPPHKNTITPDEVKVKLLPYSQGDSEKFSKTAGTMSGGCKKFYVGIGVQVTAHGVVIELQKGTPAWNAGLRFGAILLNGDDFTADQYKVGEVKPFIYLDENGKEVVTTITIAKICEKPQRPMWLD